MQKFKREFKTKGFTLQPLKPAPIIISDLASAENTCREMTIHNGQNPKFSENLHDINEREIKKKQMNKKIDVLGQMGFGSFLSSNAEINSEDSKKLKRRYSIGISEFWTEKDKERFLRNSGYMEAFKKIQENDLKSEIKHSKSIRKPDLPHVMDDNAKRRVYVSSVFGSGIQTERNISSKFVVLEPIVKKKKKKLTYTERLQPIETVFNECRDLASDTKKLKDLSMKFRDNLSKEFRGIGKKDPNKKITRYEKQKIKIDMSLIN